MKNYRIYFLGIIALSACTLSSERAYSQIWPAMKEFSETRPIEFRESSKLYSFEIPNSRGNIQYVLACHTGGSGDDDRMGIISTGGLLCILREYKLNSSVENYFSNWSLISSDDSAPAFTRGNFNPEDLVGPCAGYPDYGSVRSFRLRGFTLTISVRNLEVAKWYKGGSDFRLEWLDGDRRAFPIGRAELRVDVKPDSSAKAAKPVWSRYQNPKGSINRCRAVADNRDQPLCRSKVGRVITCPPDWFFRKWPWE